MTNAKNKNLVYYAHSVIGLLVMFGLGYLPTIGPVTEYGMKMLGIFIGIIYLWSFVDMVWPSVAAMCAYAIFSEGGIPALVTAAFGNNQLILCIFCLIIAYAVITHGIFDNFIPWMLSKKSLRGKPWVITIILLLIAFVLQLMQTQFASMFLMISIIYSICDICGIKKTSKWCAFMVGAMIVTSIFAAFFYPFSGASIFITTLFSNGFSVDYSYIQFSFFTITAYIIYMVMYVLVMKLIIRVDVTALKELDPSTLATKKHKMRKEEYVLLGILLIWLITMFITGSLNILPQNAFFNLLGTLGTTGVCFVFFILIGLVQIDGKSALNLRIIGKEMPWETIFILLVAFAVCPNLCTAETGIPELVTLVLNPILAGKSPLVFTIILFLACIILTNLANNSVVAVLVFSIISIYAADININITLACVLLTIFSQIAMFLPASSCFGAILYGEQDSIGKSNCLLVGTATTLLAMLLLLILIPFGNIVF